MVKMLMQSTGPDKPQTEYRYPLRPAVTRAGLHNEPHTKAPLALHQPAGPCRFLSNGPPTGRAAVPRRAIVAGDGAPPGRQDGKAQGWPPSPQERARH